MTPVTNTFQPINYNEAELNFIVAHAGEPKTIAMRSIHPVMFSTPVVKGKPVDRNPVGYPDGVNPNAVMPMIERIYELEELQRLTGEPWVGIPAIRACVEVAIREQHKWKADHKRGAPRFPSMHSFDGKNHWHLQGEGSDAGVVKTYFDAKGQRQPFAIQLTGEAVRAWQPEWANQGIGGTDQPDPVHGLRLDDAKRRYECVICGHTESFKPDSRGSFNAAKMRIGKHMLKAIDQKEAHREAHTLNFGSPAESR